jgi:flavin reductase (DIM6/NTAB) family NADH-FMN oxidoreductase RutF
MIHFTSADINALEQRKRATFINTLAGVKQVALVGSQNQHQQTNLAIFNSVVHIGANPPLWGLIFRPDTVRRDTLTNILAQQEYTINYVSPEFVAQAHQTSAKYEQQQSEFDAVGLHAEYLSNFNAPFVKEAVVKIGLKFEERIDIKVNNTIMIIGSIQSITLNENLLGDDGFVLLNEVLACSGLDAYYQPQLIKRMAYAKPNQAPNEL